MFQITEFMQATITSLTTRTEAHGDDRVPAVTVGIKIECANTMLDQIDPSIRHALYKAVDDQALIEGVEPTTPVLRCNAFDSIALITAHEGWTLLVDDNLDDENPMQFGAVKVDKFRVDAKQGGSIVLAFRCGTSDVDAERLGALGMHNGQDIWIKLLKPEKPAANATEATGAEIDGTTGHPGAAAGQGSLLDDGANGDGSGDGLGGFDDDMARGGPDDDAGSDTESGAPDADDGFEAGAAAAVAAAKLKPARGRKAAH